ncbi:MAG: tetratricopeptide repeat protein [Gammaproteobacteria bacterium]|nr:tetratricopeptide repeat protein [Gammaproteobacteria bacterium]
MPFLRKIFAITVLGSALYGCTSTAPVDADISSAEAIPTPSPVPEQDIEYGAFTEEQLYQTIVGEMSGQQGNLKGASDTYFKLAFETKDLGIIRRAIQFASVGGDINGVVQLGLLWAEQQPEEVAPHLMLSFQLLDAGRFEDAVNHMADVINMGGQIDFAAVSARTQRLPADRRARLIENLRQLHRLYPDQSSIQYAVVELLDQNQQAQDAIVELQILRQNYGNSPRSLLIEAQLLQKLEQLDQSRRVLRNGIRSFPEDKLLRFNYARLLIQDEELNKARRQFEILIEQDPDDHETLYSIALLDVEMEAFDEARAQFSRLIDVDHRVNESRFYLGFISEKEQKLQQAIGHYRTVEAGAANFITAQQQATRFAIELEQYDEAHDWLVDLSRGRPRLEVLFTNIETTFLMQAQEFDRAMVVLNEMLQRFPDNTDMLFTRVMLHDAMDDIVNSEQDLQRIIALQPEDARALNHLGYMLADRTTRYAEALDLIERAITISPDDAAIIDSLAWAQYKLGRYEESLKNLRRAFATFPDHEVASHLGEVLWVSGQESEAMRVWRDALKETPDSDLIKEAMQRLNP